jgi:hypothetical protein
MRVAVARPTLPVATKLGVIASCQRETMERQRIGLLLAFACGVLFIVTAFSTRWWRGGNEVGVGLLYVEECSGYSEKTECVSNPLSALPERSRSDDGGDAYRQMMWAGRASWVLTIGAALALMGASVLVMTKTRPVHLKLFGQLAILAGFAPLPAFALYPSKLVEQMSMGWTVYAHYFAVAAAGFAVAMIAPTPGPSASQPLPIPAAPQATPVASSLPNPPCPSCSKATEYIGEYQRYFCRHCQQYA